MMKLKQCHVKIKYTLAPVEMFYTKMILYTYNYWDNY